MNCIIYNCYCVDPVKVQDYDQFTIKKTEEIDKYGLLDKEYDFFWPYLLAKGPKGELIVGNNHEEAKHLVVFDEQLTCINIIGARGYGNGKFQQICGIVTDKKGFLYVTDGILNCIQKFRLENGEFKFISKFGASGDEDGQFMHPAGLSLSKSNLLFVCDRNNRRVQIFDGDSEDYLRTFKKFSIKQGYEEVSLNLHEPVDITLNINEEKLFITDWRQSEVLVLEPDDGRLIHRIKTAQHPNGIFVTPDNYLLVGSSRCVAIYNEDGKCVREIKDKFLDCIGVIMMDDGKLVVADGKTGKNRLIVFHTNLNYVA